VKEGGRKGEEKEGRKKLRKRRLPDTSELTNKKNTKEKRRRLEYEGDKTEMEENEVIKSTQKYR